MSTVSSNRIGLAVALAVLSAGCVLDTSLKNHCDLDSDCAAGHVCSQHVCRDRRKGDAAADRTSPADGVGASSDAPASPDVVAPPEVPTSPDVVSSPEVPVSPDGDADAADGGSSEGPEDADATSSDAGPERPTLLSEHPNYVFVTSEPFRPQFGSLDAADEDCRFLARNGGLPGTFRAWLSTTWIDARDRLGDARGWIRPDGQPVADTVEDLVQGRIWYPISLDEKGTKIPLTVESDPPVLTGSTEFGLLAPSANCHDWTSSAGGAVAGTINTGGGGWQWNSGVDCGTPARLFCFGVDQAVPVSVPPAPAGRVAFLSAKKIMLSSGVAGADALCQREADAAGLPGSFRALMATSTASLSTRFALALDEIWVRPDGVVLNPGRGTLFDDVLSAALDVTASRQFVTGEDYVLIGAEDAHTIPKPEQTCLDWTPAGSDLGAPAGSINRPDWWLFYGLNEACSFPHHVYCLQDRR
jgi:hypothetical protein